MKTIAHSLYWPLALLTILTVNSQLSTLFAQGSLTPPGAPAPTMKTLAQIEPRTPISSLPFTISASGSYYVTTNLSVSGAIDGITITADNVTIDLNGFALSGSGGINSAVTASSSRFNLAVRNGTIRNWGAGVNLPGAANSQFEKLQIFGNTNGAGLRAADNCLVAGCVASGNLNGIVLGDGGIVKDCSVSSSSSNGITCGSGVALSGCAATSNGPWGIIVSNNCSLHDCVTSKNQSGINSSGGILTGDNCTIIGCAANANLYSALNFFGFGIRTGNNCLVKNCTANGQLTGIYTGTYTLIQDCVVSSASPENNGIIPGDFNIVRGCMVYASYALQVGNACLIEDNLSRSILDADIHIYGTNTTAIHNSLQGFHTVSASVNNIVGTIESHTSANANKNPHANFAP